MQRKLRIWLLIGLVFLGLAGSVWWLLREHPRKASADAATFRRPPPAQPIPSLGALNYLHSNALLASETNRNSQARTNGIKPSPNVALLQNRLANTAKPLKELMLSDSAVLLRNALIDSSDPTPLTVPEHLKAQGDPGSYVVQARGAINNAFRARLQAANASIISYIPNNAYLVRAPESAANALRGSPEVQTVLPWEPYYKLDLSLLPIALGQGPLPKGERLSVLVFPGERDSSLQALRSLGATLLGEDSSPFGHQIIVEPLPNSLVPIAQLGLVQSIEPYRSRVLANDLTRVRLSVATNTFKATPNYLGLTGSNVLVNVNDTGVEAGHPDLTGRVFGSATSDGAGHGTHVAGTIASSGDNSLTIGTNAPGSTNNATFRGIAPGAKIFSEPIDLVLGPLISDAYLQKTAASTNALISNNSWGYLGLAGYTHAAANYDAAVRDILPGVTGSRFMNYVFAAGNSGGGSQDGAGGQPDSIWSPATAKNVLTIGGIENFRSIISASTNETIYLDTDSDDQVAAFSSRGNVGIGIEGDFGRFKPDLVAPATFVVSCRTTNWQDPSNSLGSIFNRLTDQFVPPLGTNFYNLVIPDEAIQLIFRIIPNDQSPPKFPQLPLYGKQTTPPAVAPNSPDFQGTNQFAVNVTPGNFWVALRNTTLLGVNYDVQTFLIVTNELGSYFADLKKLNDALAPYYRFESGTSMAAPAVSGTLALMEEFFRDKLRRTNSPALNKALLINGARTLACSQCPSVYSLKVRNDINYQGWGVVELTNTIPAAVASITDSNSWPIIMFDQDPANSLATGDSVTYNIAFRNVVPQFYPFRATLVWTDPPGNPVSSMKLVNDLDLIVTNLQTGDVYVGNDIPTDSDFNQYFPAGSSNTLPFDIVNNVENVFIAGPLAPTYSVTVRARRVNVNAITSQTNGVRQDYALVISSGNTRLTNVFTTTAVTIARRTDIDVNIKRLTNGIALFNERVGANSPLLDPIANNRPGPNPGMTNQWNFYVFENTNTSTLTNVAIITFLPPNLALARQREADIDLYVNNDPSLTNFNNAAIMAAKKSLNRGGTEFVTYINSSSQFYYIGVKSEDQQAANYAIFAIATDKPFGTRDENGNIPLNFFVLKGPGIEDGSPEKPGASLWGALALDPTADTRRLVITNQVFHEEGGDLLGRLQHDTTVAVLNNHRIFYGQQPEWIYDDSGEDVLPVYQTSDGPGTLRDFEGKRAFGFWQYTMIDNAPFHTGLVQTLVGLIEPQDDTNNANGIQLTVQPFKWKYSSLEVPVGVTNLIVSLAQQDPLPLDLYVRRTDRPTAALYDKFAPIAPPGGSLSLGRYDSPGLRSGRYIIGVSNPNSSSVTFRLRYDFQYSLARLESVSYISSSSKPLLDNAITNATITVTNARAIADVKVGVRIDHPRVSDLVLHLVSPSGTRILLAEDRGGGGATNYGAGVPKVFFVNTEFNGAAAEFRTNIDTLEYSGVVTLNWDFYDLPDSVRVYYDGKRIFDSGVVNGTNSVSVPYGPGISTVVTIAVNEGGNLLTGTRWKLDASVTGPWNYTVFTDKPTLGDPLKFAFPPFDRTPTNVIVFSNSFEGIFAGGRSTNTVPNDVAGWTVRSNGVAVLTDTNIANTGSNYLALSYGAISIPITNVLADRDYVLNFAQRKTSSSPTQSVVVTITNKADLLTAISTNPPPNIIGAVPIPKLRVCPGQDVILLVGTNCANFGADGCHGAEGDTNALVNGTPKYALLGCWSSHPTRLDRWTLASPPFYIGTNTTFAAPTDPGDYYLFLGVNDSSYADNAGSYTVDVRWQQCQLTSGQYTLGNSPVHFDGIMHTNWQAESLLFTANPSITNLTVRPDINTTLLLDSFQIQELVPSIHYQSEEPLAPLGGEYALGDWTLEVWDTRAGPPSTATNASGILLSWMLSFVFADGPATVPLTNGVAYDGVVRRDDTVYFQVAVPREVSMATNVILSAQGAGVYLMYNPTGVPEGTAPPDPIDPANIPNPFVLSNNAPVNLGLTLPVGGIYYLGVRNLNPNEVNNFSLRVDFNIPITKLVNGVTTPLQTINGNPYTFLQRQSYPSVAVSNTQYYYFDIGSTNTTSVIFRKTGGPDTHMVVRRALPVVDLFPHQTFFDYESTQPPGRDDVIIINSNSIPVKVAPGRYYVGVYSTRTNQTRYTLTATTNTLANPITYTYTNILIPKTTNLIVVPFTISRANMLTSFYRFIADRTNAAALFEIFGLNNDADLIVRRSDLPYFDLYDFSSLSMGPMITGIGTNQMLDPGYEPIPLRTNVFIPHLNATNWYISILEGTPTPSTTTTGMLCIKLFDVLNPIVGCAFSARLGIPVGTNNTICWDAVAGTQYVVEKSSDLINWTALYTSPKAPGGQFCANIPAPSATTNEFYRIRAE